MGYWAGMTLYPETKCTPQRAVDILETYGTERLWMNSAGDWGPSDPLAVPKARAGDAVAAATVDEMIQHRNVGQSHDLPLPLTDGFRVKRWLRPALPRRRIGYCTNVHAGATHLQAMQWTTCVAHAPLIRDQGTGRRLSPLPIGLWLSRHALDGGQGGMEIGQLAAVNSWTTSESQVIHDQRFPLWRLPRVR